MNDITWTMEKVLSLFELPFFNLIQKSYSQHAENFDPTEIEFCALLNIKTGTCPEDCAYCPQSAHYNTSIKPEKLYSHEMVINHAKEVKKNGAKRFCLGAAWRGPVKKDFPRVLKMITDIKALGLEVCVTLGLLDQSEALQLKEAGLDYYNHNLDTSPEYYPSIITTRNYQDRLETIDNVINADINVCCGGILGMGETREDRINLLLQLKKLKRPPLSIPINKLIPIPGTPLASTEPIDNFEFIKTIAITRLMFPTSRIRLSAGRTSMTNEMQAWCFIAGANSIFIGEKLLTAGNPELENDMSLLKKLGIKTDNACIS